MSKLLKLLDPNLTPDQNVQRLKCGMWIKGSEMTREQYDALLAGPQNGRVRLTEYYGHRDEQQRWWLGGLSDRNNYTIGDWTWRNIQSRDHLWDYYFIPFEDYVDGNLPPEPADG